MGDLPLPADLQQVEVAQQVGPGIGAGVLQAVTNARLGSEVDDPVELRSGQRRFERRLIGDIDLMKSEVAASCPQAAAISRPRVSRTVHATPAACTRRTNSSCTGRGEASHSLPGVGLSGIRLTCTRCLPMRWASRLPSRSARQGWSLTSRISAYSIDTRRPVVIA